jgi:tetratricopeptide (TPR) repeat protein
MRKLTSKAVIAAMLLLGLAEYGIAMPEPEQGKASIESMTITQLESAGDAARGQKDFQQAIKYFEAALRKNRKKAVLRNKLGLAQLQAGDLREARKNFERAAKLDRNYPEAVNNMGAVDYMRKNYGSAAKNFKKALALDETRTSFHVNLGAAWFGQKKLDRAIAEYTRALELDPDALTSNVRTGVAAQIASPEERALYSFMLAKIYARRGEVDRCLECLRLAKERGYRDLANVYYEQEFTNLRQDPRLQEIVPPPAH